MERSIIQPAGVAAPGGTYSHGVSVSAPRTLYVAGQVPLDESGELVGRGDPRAQAAQVFENLRRVVEEAGGRMGDIAKTTVFLVDLAHRSAVGEVRNEVFDHDPPANSLVVVTSLVSPDFLVEVEAIVPLPA